MRAKESTGNIIGVVNTIVQYNILLQTDRGLAGRFYRNLSYVPYRLYTNNKEKRMAKKAAANVFRGAIERPRVGEIYSKAKALYNYAAYRLTGR